MPVLGKLYLPLFQSKQSHFCFTLIFNFIVFAVLVFSQRLDAEELLKDPHFQKGVSVKKVDKRRTRSLSHIQVSDGIPVWTLAEWGTKKSILEGAQKPAEGFLYQGRVQDDEGQLIKAFFIANRDPQVKTEGKDKPDYDFYMELNGLAEFSGRHENRLYREIGEWWPNFLLGQKLHSKTLRNYESIVLSLDAKLVSAEANYQSGYNKNLHAGRFVVSVTLRDMVGRNYLWLNFPIYDDRYEFSAFGCRKCEGEDCERIYRLEDNVDWQCPIDAPKKKFKGAKPGTKKMMFRVGSKEFTDKPMMPGEWQSFEINLMPYISEASRAAQQQESAGSFTAYKDFYFLGSLNLGWEISGLNHNAIQIRNLSLQVQRKK